MIKKFFEIYKIQLLVVIALTIVLLAVGLFKTPTDIAFISVATLLGMFTLDLDYILYAYFIEPDKDFSRNLRGYLAHRDITGVLDHIKHNKNEVEDKTLNSALFQILLAGITIFAMSSTASFAVKAFIISTFANSIFRFTDFYYDGKIAEWFWALKSTPTSNRVILYGILMVSVLVYSISLF